MSRRRRHLEPGEAALWAHAVKDVRASGKKAAPPPPPEVKPEPPPATTVKKAALAPGPALAKKGSSHAPPKPHPLRAIDPRTSEKLRRGRREIEARLDLHGLTQARAHAVLLGFIQRSSAAGLRTLLVITGKGSARQGEDGFMPGEGRGVLKTQVPRWLEEPAMRSLVWGIEEAGRSHGGSGAYYVLLKRQA